MIWSVGFLESASSASGEHSYLIYFGVSVCGCRGEATGKIKHISTKLLHHTIIQYLFLINININIVLIVIARVRRGVTKKFVVSSSRALHHRAQDSFAAKISSQVQS